MGFSISALYAGLCGLLLILLSARIGMMRRKYSVGLGSGEHSVLEQAIRAQGNFIEYVPLALILLAFGEAGGMAGMQLHLAGSLLVIGRVLHAFGLSQSGGVSAGRLIGIVLTWLVIIVLSIANIAGFFS